MLLSCDSCPGEWNWGDRDPDKDFWGNGCDNCDDDFNFNQGDYDRDGFGDECDNCPFNSNSLQEDFDLDGVGDECDLCPKSDTIAVDYNSATYLDEDGDTLHDYRCDLCPGSAPPGGWPNRYEDDAYDPMHIDSDDDGAGDRCDNCPVSNPDQANCNYQYELEHGLASPPYSYGLGDVCDPDPCVSLCDESDPLSSEGNASPITTHTSFRLW